MDGIVLEWTGRYGDFNADGRVNLTDYAMFAEHWLESPAADPFDIAPDDPDRVIDFLDLAQFAGNWLNIRP